MAIQSVHIACCALQLQWVQIFSEGTFLFQVKTKETHPLLICTRILRYQVGKSSLTNWIFLVQKSILKLIFAGYTGSINPVRNGWKIQFVKLDFSKLIFQKSSIDQQGDSVTKVCIRNFQGRLITEFLSRQLGQILFDIALSFSQDIVQTSIKMKV